MVEEDLGIEVFKGKKKLLIIIIVVVVLLVGGGGVVFFMMGLGGDEVVVDVEQKIEQVVVLIDLVFYVNIVQLFVFNVIGDVKDCLV